MSAPVWTKGRISVPYMSATTGKHGVYDVDADIFGGLAIHEAVGVFTDDNAPVLSITHVATGHKVSSAYFDDRANAIAAVTALVALPVRWTEKGDLATPSRKPFLRNTVEMVVLLCGGFEIFQKPDQPVGRA